MPKYYSLLVITIFLLFHQCQSEVYTSTVDLEDLLDTEEVLLRTIETYIEAEKQKIDLLKRYADMYHKHQNIARRDTELYLSNPNNAYTLVKRLTADWSEVEALISTNINQEALLNISYYKENMKFPTEEDLNGAAVGLIRLQDTYQLDTASIARGELNGVRYSSELTAGDCFELGKQSYYNEDFYHTKLWMQEAEAMVKRETNKTVAYSDVLEYLAYSMYKLGDVDFALNLTNKLLEIIPNHGRGLGNKVYYEDILKTYGETAGYGKKGETDDDQQIRESQPINTAQDELHKANYPVVKNVYEALCRGEEARPLKLRAKLKCKYVNKGNPFLFIAPFKVEEIYLDPELYIYHDVISDSEIKTIKSMAIPRFQRSRVHSATFGSVVTGHRTGKTAWLKEQEHKHIADVSRRTGDMTGLNMKSSEQLQVVNYGIGGHYEPHYDFAAISDVEQGGATVFPIIGAAIWPKKGSAAFWYNLFPSGDGDTRTRHAACPVLIGSKWITNKWLHEKGQEFLRPCSKDPPLKKFTV